jgi:hypothetical protein
MICVISVITFRLLYFFCLSLYLEGFYFSINFPTVNYRSVVTAPLAVATRGVEGGGNKGCPSCTGKGAVNCATCRGTGIDRVNGNVFERWTCTKVIFVSCSISTIFLCQNISTVSTVSNIHAYYNFSCFYSVRGLAIFLAQFAVHL